ncbi:MAG: type II toxin-antitoxin system VapC family toxin [Candidatus Aenigmarchaeota archaeon]|nr:type II toxin-antitoxin system VapC family toxin [Candidatus Aenigmarchaeota archaeon]
MMTIFIDANMFVSFCNSADQNHEIAKKIMSDILDGKYGSMITSDYVFDETLTVTLARTKNLDTAIAIGKFILSYTDVEPVNLGVLREAWEIFKNDNQQKMSFTDCTSRVFVEKLGIKNIATFDRAFKNIDGIIVVDG